MLGSSSSKASSPASRPATIPGWRAAMTASMGASAGTIASVVMSPARPRSSMSAARTIGSINRRSISFPQSRQRPLAVAGAPCVLRDAPLRSAPQDEENLFVALKTDLILRRPRSGSLEGRTAPNRSADCQHALDGSPRPVGDLGLDRHLMGHGFERVPDVPQRDPLHMRAQIARPHKIEV